MNSNTEISNGCDVCEFKDNLEILRGIDFFSRFPLEPLKLFAYLCQRVVYHPDDLLFAKDDDDGQAFYVLSGKLGAFRPIGEKQVMIREFSKGDFVGSLAMFGASPRLYSLGAITRAECLFITREKFIRVVDQFPDIKARVFMAIVQAIRKWDLAALSQYDETCDAGRPKAGVSLL